MFEFEEYLTQIVNNYIISAKKITIFELNKLRIELELLLNSSEINFLFTGAILLWLLVIPNLLYFSFLFF